MSSILDALEKLETTRGPQPPGGGRGPERRRPPWRVVLGVLAVVAAAGAAVLVLQRGDAPRTVAVAESPQASTPPDAGASARPAPAAPNGSPRRPDRPAKPARQMKPLATPSPAGPEATRRAAAPVPAPSADGERPWGAEPEPPAPPASPPSTAVLAVAHVPPSPPPTLAPARIEPPPSPPPHAEAPPPSDASPAEPARVSSRPPAGAPRMRVSFLVYSSSAARRSVALTIADGGLTTLREGDEADGVSVVRIHPDRVELRWQGETFTLEVRS